MTMRRGNFVLECNGSNCDNIEDLGTIDFEEAKEEANRLEEEEGWTTVKRGSTYAHLCRTCG